MKQAVVLRVLDAAGWSAFDLSEVEPDFQVGSARVDYALKSASSARQRASSTPRVLVEVKSLTENLESERHQRRLINHCGRAEVELGVLTNGPELAVLSLVTGGGTARQSLLRSQHPRGP